MDINRKYNTFHNNNLEYWNHISTRNIEEIKSAIYAPYKHTQKFEPVYPSFLHQFRPLNLILDYGCGIGRNFSTLKKVSKHIHAYDLPGMVEKCKQYNTEDVDLITDNIDKIKNNKYDIIFDIQTLQFFGDYNAIYEYLYMVSQISTGFYLITRSYIESEDKENVLKIINRTNRFNLLYSTVGINKFINAKIEEQIHAELLFAPKTIKYFPITVNSDRSIIDNDDEQTDIAFLDDAYNTYKGGQYYNTLVALALQELGYQVTIYSSQYQPILSNFYDYQLPRFKICETQNLDIPFCSAYFGSPGNSAIRALELSKTYNRPAFIFLYDCPSNYENLNVSQDFIQYEFNNYNNIRQKAYENYKNGLSINFIVLTDDLKTSWSKWMNIPIHHFHTITPFINSKVLRTINFKQKSNQIVALSRYAWNKNWIETFEIFRNFQKDYVLHIITDNINDFWKDISKTDVFNNKIVFHTNISDIEKFYIIGKSKLLINNSIFEGFGMWAIEAISCGTPVVCYDLPSLKNVINSNIVKVNNKNDFLTECKNILEKNSFVSSVSDYDFESGLKLVKKTINGKIEATIGSYEHVTKEYYDISTIYKTKPFVFHFTSIYNKITSIHYPESRQCWNKIINSILNYNNKVKVSSEITIFTFNNKPIKSILEICCEILGIPLIVLGKNVLKWHHNDRIKYILDFIEYKNTKYFLHVDALDAVIFGNINQILDSKIDDTVLFNAQSVCHPDSPYMSDQIEKIAPKDTNFKHVNGGVCFGTKKSIQNLFKVALETKKYESTQPICDDCDQGKFVTILTQNPNLLKLDYFCKHFYCGDATCDSSKYLIFNR